ncbi:hypothetical protein BD309DRAFT_964748 [Dichomitus squalens]|uniref:Secreted protein n=1 Tax=Dichomitus squalens TaxID=114155 RepID=A0A4Q9MV24_9APHY|nr:hypothetical protein BD311DRAFT_752408 [Dichomitus squalens]TBU41693.1 hypothetical protein BD309DRAFT_964748 [Dichomitus squalens]TBU64284.1 hypothetical protein BD310DRAFT_914380 [Dichomitus squalens]
MALWVFWIFAASFYINIFHDAPCNPYVRLWQCPHRCVSLCLYLLSVLNHELSYSISDRPVHYLVVACLGFINR